MSGGNIIELETWRGTLQKDGKKGYTRNLTNLMIFLANVRELGPKIKWNELSQCAEWDGKPILDHHLIDIRLILEDKGFEPFVSDVLPAVTRHARLNGYHPVREYLGALEWDGFERLDRWMTTFMGAPDTAFTRSAGRKTMIAAVARAYEPGCKVDTVLILEGPQGVKKSTAIATLFGQDWTAESVNLFDQHNKMVMSMMGAWCVELAEFIAVAKRDENTVKGLISMRSDRVILPYAKLASDHPRQCVFFGTMNPKDNGYLTDETGNRRYWPVPVTKADIAQIAMHRDQLWAEACVAYDKNERWWFETDEEKALAEGEAQSRQIYDSWVEALEEKLHGYREVKTLAALELIGILHDRVDRKAEIRIAACLRSLGWKLTIAKDKDRKSYRKWIKE